MYFNIIESLNEDKLESFLYILKPYSTYILRLHKTQKRRTVPQNYRLA